MSEKSNKLNKSDKSNKTSKSRQEIYLDNNASTLLCVDARKEMCKWNRTPINPSGISKQSIKARKMIDCGIKKIEKHCKTEGKYKIIFTSGASESNSLIIRSVVDGWLLKIDAIPHMVVSSIEHVSILACVNALVKLGRLEVTFINPNIYGIIEPNDISESIKPNTCLVCVMMANNEIGSINPIREIAKASHAKGIPIHCDVVQSFGKERIDVCDLGIDSMSVSFHKLYGPTGIGLLVLSNNLIKSYNLCGQINGKQQWGFRAGTENTCSIGGAIVALSDTFKNRLTKNKHLLTLRNLTIKCLSEKFDYVDYTQIMTKPKSVEEKKGTIVRFCVIGPSQQYAKMYLPSTLLLCFLSWRKNLCNVEIKRALARRGITVSVGSTCNSNSSKASHVVHALGLSQMMRRGVIRVSFSDNSKTSDVKELCKALKTVV